MSHDTDEEMTDDPEDVTPSEEEVAQDQETTQAEDEPEAEVESDETTEEGDEPSEEVDASQVEESESIPKRKKGKTRNQRLKRQVDQLSFENSQLKSGLEKLNNTIYGNTQPNYGEVAQPATPQTNVAPQQPANAGVPGLTPEQNYARHQQNMKLTDFVEDTKDYIKENPQAAAIVSDGTHPIKQWNADVLNTLGTEGMSPDEMFNVIKSFPDAIKAEGQFGDAKSQYQTFLKLRNQLKRQNDKRAAKRKSVPPPTGVVSGGSGGMTNPSIEDMIESAKSSARPQRR